MSSELLRQGEGFFGQGIWIQIFIDIELNVNSIYTVDTSFTLKPYIFIQTAELLYRVQARAGFAMV